MTVFYSLGDGLGHFTRARAASHTLRLSGQIVYLMTRPPKGIALLPAGEEIRTPTPDTLRRGQDLADWLNQQLAELRPDLLFLDTFPSGLRCEWSQVEIPSGCEFRHFARNLRWTAISDRVTKISRRFDVCYRMEELDPLQEKFLRAQSALFEDLALVDPPAILPVEIEEKLERWSSDRRPLWLIVHSGPGNEVVELIQFARELAEKASPQPRFLLISPGTPDTIPLELEFLNFYPAHLLFPRADRVITACGFNLMRQAALLARRHDFLPFPRRYDDQAARGSRYRKLRAQNQFIQRNPGQLHSPQFCQYLSGETGPCHPAGQ